MFLYPVFGEVYKVVRWITPEGYRPPADVGVAYSEQLEATSKTGPVSYSLVSGSLPNGITLSSSGLLSGTPTELSNAMFAVRAFVTSDPTVYADREFGLASRDVPGYVVLANTQVFASKDMMTWVSTTYPVGVTRFLDVIYGNKVYIARSASTTADANGNRAYLWVSSDGQTWAQVLQGTETSDFSHLLYGNGRFLACGAGVAATSGVHMSTDGLTWSKISSARVSPAGCFGDGKFFGSFAANLLISTDNGVTWTTAVTSNATLSNGVAWMGVAYNRIQGKFLALDYGGWPYTSTDGFSWTKGATTAVTTNVTVGTGGNFFWLAPPGSSATTYSHRYSTDGVTFAIRSLSFGMADIEDGDPSMIVAGGGLDARVHSSTDGTNFTSSPKLGSNPNLLKIATSKGNIS